jgi:hypothetical protein
MAAMGAELHAEHLRALRERRRPDGGFATGRRAPSEVEPTILAGLALGGDEHARSWLSARQRDDGGFEEASGRHDGPTTAALASLLLEGGAARRALAFAVAHRGLPLPGEGDERHGWGWTADTRSFVEPTSRVLIAANRLTPADAVVIGEATRLLRTWQCADHGWNHGVATVLGDDLTGYAQTTAVALIALRRERDEGFVRRGLAFLRNRWHREAGRLTTAQAQVAFRLHGVDDDVERTTATLERLLARVERASTVGLAWSALATGPDELLEPLRGGA